MPGFPRITRFTTFTRFRFIVAVVAMLSAASAFADAGSTISGTVIDPDGAAVARAEVLVIARGAVIARAITDSSGAFSANDLPADTYELQVVREGFRAEAPVIALASGEARSVSVKLRISAVTEAIVVSASHVDQPLSKTPASVALIDAKDLALHQDATVAEALGRVPGLTVARTGTAGAVTSLFPRGGESDYTLVVIDGVPLNAFGGSYDFADLTTGDVERIEVVRGPQSARWGGGAIGGVVDVITTPESRTMGTALVEGGSHGSWRAGGRGSIASGAWTFGFGGDATRSDGLDGELARNGQVISNDDWWADNASLTSKYASSTTSVQGVARFARNERGYPGPYGSDPAGTYTGIDTVSRGIDRRVLAGGSFARTTGTTRWSGYGSWMRLSSDFASPYGPSNSGTRRANAGGRVDLRVTRLVGATLGGEWLDERANSTYITGLSFNPIPVRRSVAAAFGEARFDGGPWFVTAGARVERIARASLEANPDPFSPRPLLPADVVVAVTPRVSAAYFLRPATDAGWTRLRASAGLGIRPPDAFELAFTDNAALKPERSRSVEAGLEHALAGGRVVAEGTVFLNRYDDLIVTVGRSLANASQYQSDNISNARSRGIELLVNTRMPRGLRASVAYTFLATEILAVDRLGIAPPPFAVGDPLVRRPRHQAWVDLSWTGARGSAFAELGARARTLDIEPTFGAFGGLFENPGYEVVNVGGSVSIAGPLEAYARVTNLANRQYEEVLGFPALGRSVVAGIRIADR